MSRKKIIAKTGGSMNPSIGMRHGKAGIVVFFLLTCAAFALWAPNAHAQSTYFNDTTRGNCIQCHPASPTTCNGCHHHGPSGLNATTDKTTYAPGEAITVTFRGGRSSGATNGAGGWIRAILYDQNGVEVAQSTGPSGMGGGSGFPVTFTTVPAPAARTASYTFTAAWFGNSYDSAPANTNGIHGEVRVSTNAFTVTAASVAGPLSVSPAGGMTSTGTFGGPFTPSSQAYTLTNTGTASINWTASKTQTWVTLSAASGTLAAGATATVTASINAGANTLAASSTGYSDTVTFTNTTNGTGNTTRPVSLTVNATTVALTISTASPLTAGTVGTAYTPLTFASTGGTGTKSWAVSAGTLPAGLTLSSAGVLSGTPTAATAVPTPTFTVRVTDGASATATKTFSLTINPAPVAGGVTEMPVDGAVDVPVNTVISGTLTGAGDIVKIFNAQTFSLKVKGPATGTTSLASPNDGCVDDGIVKGAISYNALNTAGTFTPTCLLTNGTVYTAAIASPTGGLSGAETWEFTTIVASPDTDGDGVPDNEDDHPGNKGKGTPPSSRGHGKFLIDVTDTAGASLDVAKGMAETDASLNQAGMPSGYEFPDGLVSYQVVGVVPGSTIPVKVTFPSGIPAGSKVYKVGPTGFKEVGNPAIQGNTVTLTLTDGGSGDSDGLANGVIVDPVGVATPAASGTGSVDLSSASGAGGCSVAVRTGSGASAIDGTLILAGIGLTVWGIRIRRRRG